MTNETIDMPLWSHNYAILRSLLVLLLLGVGIYFGAIFWLGWGQFAFVFNQLGVLVLLAGGGVASIAYVGRFARWHYLLSRLGYRIPVWNNLKIYLAGLALTASPAKLGETVRSLLLVPHGVQVQHSLSAFLADRLSDVLGVCLLGVLAGLLAGKSVWLLASVFLLLLLGSYLIRFAITLQRGEHFLRLGIQKIRWLPLKGGKAMLKSWAQLWSPGRVAAFTLIAMLAYGVQALVFSWFCKLTGIPISVADMVLIFIQATLFGAASMIPGGLGVMEAALVVQLVAQGADQGVALSVAIATRLVTFWLSFFIGFFTLLLSTKSCLNTAEEVKIGT